MFYVSILVCRPSRRVKQFRFKRTKLRLTFYLLISINHKSCIINVCICYSWGLNLIKIIPQPCLSSSNPVLYSEPLRYTTNILTLNCLIPWALSLFMNMNNCLTIIRLALVLWSWRKVVRTQFFSTSYICSVFSPKLFIGVI